MSLTTLTALRDHLKADPALSAWFDANYPGKTVRHFIGYKKPVSAQDYPALCYVPVRSRVGQEDFDRLTLSIVISINEKCITNDVFDGVAQSDACAALIVEALLGPTSDFNLEGDLITINTDLGLAHPFYDTELQFTLLT